MVLKRNMPIVIVNDSSTASRFRDLSRSYNAISIDLEGNDLCRTGQIYTIQIFIPSLNEAYIFDCRKLEKSDVIRCLQNILADYNIKKYMFDCRSDADALYHQYGLRLNNVIDIQLYEAGYRKSIYGNARYYSGLSKTLKDNTAIPAAELAIKDKINAQYRSKNYELNLDSEETKAYLMIDILYLERLYNLFASLSGNTMRKIREETVRRQNIWMTDFKKDRSMAVSAI